MKVLILAHIRNTNKLKILITGWYILRSVALRGLVNSILMMRDDMRFEKTFGVNTASLKRSSSADFFHYQGASYRVLLRIFGVLPQYLLNFEFFDIGCGKGRAAFVAENCGFTTCGGIDLDEELIKTAVENISLYKLKRPESVFLFECANALNYEYRPLARVYFLFNPFSESVLDQVLRHILKDNKQETWFIYMNPKYPQPFVRRKMALMTKLKTRWYTEALIFCHKTL